MASKNKPSERVTTAREFRGDLSPCLHAYTHQPDLTGRLDKLGDAEFTATGKRDRAVEGEQVRIADGGTVAADWAASAAEAERTQER